MLQVIIAVILFVVYFRGANKCERNSSGWGFVAALIYCVLNAGVLRFSSYRAAVAGVGLSPRESMARWREYGHLLVIILCINRALPQLSGGSDAAVPSRAMSQAWKFDSKGVLSTMHSFSRALLLIAAGSGYSGIPVCAQTSDEAVECGPKDQKVKIELDGKNRPQPVPTDGKAMVYFIEVAKVTRELYQTNVAVNGKWVGATRGDSYFFLETDPGLLKICTQLRAFNSKFLYLTAEPGQIYYVNTRSRVVRIGVQASQMKEDDARKALSRKRYRYSRSRVEPQ